MAEAVGYAILPVTLSIKGAQQQLTKELVGPAQSAAKKASDSVRKQLSSGADQAAKAVEAARRREETATRKVVDAEKALKSARDTAEQKAKSVESAELKLQAARSTEKSKVADAEKKLADLRTSGKATTEQLQSAERNLEAVRATQGAKVIDAENRVQAARSASTSSADKAAAAEDKLATAKSRAATASQSVIDATRKLDEAQSTAARSADSAQGAFSRLKAKLSEMKESMFGAKSGAESAGAAASDMGSKFRGAHGSSESLGSSLGGFAKKAGLAAAAFAGLSGIGSTIQAGFDKVNKIEDTTASLGIMMGSAERATTVMDQLKKSNENTPYTFDAWSEAGKNLVAFGIDADKTAGIVTALGEAASASGKGEEALNSMGRAFGTAAATGKISMETINSLAEGGVNGLAILANNAGVTTAEMEKMISSGTVPAAESIDVLTKGIMEGSDGAAGATTALTGTMEAMSETTSGRLKNMKAAFNNLAGSIMGSIAPAIGNVAKVITDGVYVIKGWVDALISGGGALDGVRSALGALAPIFKPLAAAIGAATGALAMMKLGQLAYAGATKVAVLATKLFKGALDMLLRHPIVAAIAAVVGALTWFFTSTETGRKVWGQLMDAFQSAWKWLKDTFAPVFSAIGDAARTMWDGVVDAVQPILGVFDTVKDAWEEITIAFTGGDWGYGALSDLIGADKAEWIVNAIATVGDKISSLWDILKQIPDLASGIWDIFFKGDYTGLPFGLSEDSGIVDFLLTLRDTAMTVGGWVKDALGGALSSVWDALKDIGPAVMDVGKALGGAFLDAAMGVWEAVKGLWEGLKSLWDALSPLLLPVLKVVGAVLGGVVLGSILAVVGALKVFSVIVKVVAKVIAWLAENILAPLISVLGKVAQVVGVVLGKAFEILGGVVKWIAGLIGDVLGGVWDGITAAWDVAVGFLTDLFSGLWEGMQAAWESIGKPIVDFIGDAFSVLWEGIQLGGRLLMATFEVIWLTIQHVWDAVGQPIVDFISSAFSWLWDEVLSPVFGWIGDKWSDMITGFQIVWDSYGQPAMDAISGAFSWLWDNIISPIVDWIKDKWDDMVRGFKILWDQYGQPAVDAIVGVFNWFKDRIGDAFDTIKDFASGLWQSISDWFGKIGDKVGSIKDTILDKVKGAKDWLVDTGKNVIQGLLNGIGDLGKKITDWFLDKIPGWMKEPFKKALGIHSPSRVFKGFGVNVGQGLIDGIDSMGSKVEKASQSMADRVADADMPTLQADVQVPDAVAPAVHSAAQPAEVDTLSPVLQQQDQQLGVFGDLATTTMQDVVGPVWDQMGQGITDVKTGLVDPAFAGIQTGLQTIGTVVTSVTGDTVNPVWQAMGANIQNVKATVVDPAFLGVQTGLQAVGQKFVDSVNGVIDPQWSGMANHILAVKDGSILPAFGGVQSGLDTLGGWFSRTVDNIGTAWDRMRGATGRPAKFVVQTVFNDGIRSAWDSIAEMIGEKKMGAVPLGGLGAYKTGGVTPGYTPGRDVHRYTSPTGGRLELSGGEAIMRPEWTRAVGGEAAVNRMNRDARTGKLKRKVRDEARANSYQHFATGGVVDAMTRIVHKKYPGMQLTSGGRASNDLHGMGLAGDFSDGSRTPGELSLARDIAKTYPNSMELIHDNPAFSDNIKNGQKVGKFGGFYNEAQAGPHYHHVHWAMNTPPTMDFGGGVFAGGSAGGAMMISIADSVKSMWDEEIKKIPKWGGGPGAFGDVPPKWQKQAEEKVWKFAKKKADEMEVSIPGGSGVERWKPMVRKAFAFQNEPLIPDHFNRLMQQMANESNGDPGVTQHGYVDANTGGNEAVGLFQFAKSTWPSYWDPRTPNDRKNPWSNINAGVRYARDRHHWGPIVGSPGGWKTGGVLPMNLFDTGGVLKDGGVAVNQSGKPEPVLNNQQWTDVSGLVDGISKLVPEVKKFAPEIQKWVDDNPDLQTAVEVTNRTMADFGEKHPDVAAEATSSMTEDALDFFGMKGAWFTDASALGIEWEVPAEVEEQVQDATATAADASEDAADAASSAADAAQSASVAAGAAAEVTGEAAEAPATPDDSVPAPTATAAKEPQMEKKTLDNSTVVNFVVENVQAADPQAAARDVMREARRVLAAYA
ncbi:tape measure protein [Corynebacterium nuruki]|uniref:tape measure protein n=1 Tax=Corynebacterium nuruki TaxID=1032851 RepID=UPI0002485C4E|nr:tape measure protein [Corynebacterium nuruki]